MGASGSLLDPAGSETFVLRTGFANPLQFFCFFEMLPTLFLYLPREKETAEKETGFLYFLVGWVEGSETQGI